MTNSLLTCRWNSLKDSTPRETLVIFAVAGANNCISYSYSEVSESHVHPIWEGSYQESSPSLYPIDSLWCYSHVFHAQLVELLASGLWFQINPCPPAQRLMPKYPIPCLLGLSHCPRERAFDLQNHLLGLYLFLQSLFSFIQPISVNTRWLLCASDCAGCWGIGQPYLHGAYSTGHRH